MKKLFSFMAVLLLTGVTLNATTRFEETLSTKRGSTYIVKAKTSFGEAWPSASQWFTGYEAPEAADNVEGNQFDNDYTNVTSYGVSVRGKKLNGSEESSVGLYFSAGKVEERNYVKFEGPIIAANPKAMLHFEICSSETDGGDLAKMVLKVNDKAIAVPETTLGSKLVTSEVKVALPNEDIESLYFAFDNLPADNYKFISRFWISTEYSYTINVAANNSAYGVVSGGGTFVKNATTILSAVPAEGYQFVSWSDGNTENPRQVTVTEDATYIANFGTKMCKLTTLSNDDERGSVSGNGTYAYGTLIEILATPNTGYQFSSWSDGNTDNPRQVQLIDDITYTAIFGTQICTLSVLSNNDKLGVASGSGMYAYGTQLSIVATPADGYQFIRWSDGNTDNPRQVTVTSNAIYTAIFSEVQYSTITLTAATRAYVDKGDGNGYQDDKAIFLSSYSNDEIKFKIDEFEFGQIGCQYNSKNTPVAVAPTSKQFIQLRKVDSSDEPKATGAIYNLSEMTLSNLVILQYPNNVSFKIFAGDAIGTLEEVVLPTAVAAKFEIVKSDETTEEIDVDKFVINLKGKKFFRIENAGKNVIYLASIVVNSFSDIEPPVVEKVSITATSNNDKFGTVTGGGQYETGTNVTLTAIPSEGAQFVSWSDGNTDNPRVVVADQDLTFTAVFVAEYNTVLFLDFNSEVLSEQYIAYNAAAILPENPSREGYIFTGWNVDIKHITARTFAIAQYEKIGVNVTYKSEEGDIVAMENVDIHIPIAPEVIGKTFSGWLTESADSENGIVLRATYTLDNPTIDDNVTVTPNSTSAAVTFPYITGAMTYMLIIRDLSGRVVCKIMFDATGHLLGIAFAPDRKQAQQTQTTGFQFVIEGLESNTTYEYEFIANDENDEVIEILTGAFTTTEDTPTTVDNSQHSLAPQKILRGGIMYILKNGEAYNAQGAKVE